MEEGNYSGSNTEYNTLSILAFIFSFIFFPVGFILGIVSLSHISKTHERGKGLAIAAIIIGSLFLIFFLMLIFVGLTWIAIRNTVQIDYGDMSLDSKCMETQIVATQVLNSGTDYSVTLQRKAGDDEIGGVKLVFTDGSQSTSFLVDVSGNIQPMQTRIVNADLSQSGLTNPNKISVMVYFLDENGHAQLCQIVNALDF